MNRRRWLATWLGVTAVALAACADDDRVADAEAAIAAVLAERLDRPVADVGVSCPEDAPLDDGSTLTCDVTVGAGTSQPVAFAIAEGGVARLESAVIPVQSAEDYLAAELAGPAASGVEVGCGDDELLVVEVGGEFTCDAVRTADQVTFVVRVEVTSLDGTVRYRVETPATTTTTAAPPASP